MRLEKSARGNDKEESTGGTMMTGGSSCGRKQED